MERCRPSNDVGRRHGDPAAGQAEDDHGVELLRRVGVDRDGVDGEEHGR